MVRQFPFYLFLLLMFMAGPVLAQPQAAGEPEVLIDSAPLNFQSPVWSPDGQHLAFTSARQVGIWIADADGSNLRQVTSESAGYGFSWSSDSESILARVSKYENQRRKLAVKIYSATGDESRQVTDYRDNMPALPVWANFDQNVVLISGSKIESFDSGKQVPDAMKRQPNQYFYVLKTDQIARGMVPENSKEDISPFEDATYLNLQVSPDGQKLAFEVYGGNLYVMNTDGTGLTDLGQANRPRWSPDSKYVVAMVAEDDGHNYTRSDLYALSADGAERINLTGQTDIIAMNPSWSPDGNKIVFDSPDTGLIYVLNLK